MRGILSRSSPQDESVATTYGSWSGKKADLARRAIDYPARHDFTVRWEFSDDDPPPEGIRQLVMSYFGDGEIERTTAGLLRDYLLERLAKTICRPTNGAARIEPPGPGTRRVEWSVATMSRGGRFGQAVYGATARLTPL